MNFCVDCGCDSFEVVELGAYHPLLEELKRNLGKDVRYKRAASGADARSGSLDPNVAEVLAVGFRDGLLPAGRQPIARLSIRFAARVSESIYLQMPRSDHSVILSFTNDLQAEALYRLGIRFQVSPTRPDLKPRGDWIDYGSANLYLHAPSGVSLDPKRYDKKRWIGAFETYGYDWFRCLENEYIQRWWTPRHDGALRDAIREEGWTWSPPREILIGLAGQEVIERWRKEDWRCQRWTWYNILDNYAIQRAKELRLTEGKYPPDAWRACPLCKQVFHQSRLWRNWLCKEQLVICPVCFEQATWARPKARGREDVLKYLRSLAEVIQRVPRSDFGEEPLDYAGLSPMQVTEVIRLRQERPALSDVKAYFQSWFGALVEAGVLPGGSQRMARGIRCIAEDGHVCFSLGEKVVCDIFHRHGIMHEREVEYPGSTAFRADWSVGGTLIEYFGLTGQPEYDAKTDAKKKIAAEFGLTLIALYPEDLVDQTRLINKLGTVLKGAPPLKPRTDSNV